MIEYIEKANEKSQTEIMTSLLFIQGDNFYLRVNLKTLYFVI